MVLGGCASGPAVYEPVHEALQHGQLLQEELGGEGAHARLLPSMLLLLHGHGLLNHCGPGSGNPCSPALFAVTPGTFMCRLPTAASLHLQSCTAA